MPSPKPPGLEPPAPGEASVQRKPGDSMEAASAVATPIGPAAHPLLPRLCPTCEGRFPANFKVCPHDATPLQAAPEEDHDRLLGTTLAESYQIVRLIGEGGMGRVYEARHTRLRNKRFAIKVLVEEYAHQPEVVARFEREAEAASAIAHPNVVGVFDVHRLPDGRPYIVGEYLEGQEFGELLDRVGVLEPQIAVRIVRQVCMALDAAHAHGVIHRDMKPENVFLIGDPAAPLVKVLDFGISKQDDGRANLTRTGMVMGTPSYMAPEQARGEKVDHRADLYAVGAILYRSVTGQPPYDGEDGAMVLTKVLTEDPPRPRDVNPKVLESLELVIQRAMARSPDDRYRSMVTLEADLADLDPFGPLPRASSTMLTPLANVTVVDTSGETEPPQGPATPEPLTERAQQTARLVRSTRPLLILHTVLSYFWIAAGLVALAVDMFRWTRGAGGSITGAEVILIVIGTLLASATPLVLWVRYLERDVWRNTPRCLEIRELLGSSLIASVSAYGLLALVVVLAEGVFERLPLGATKGAWGGPLFLVALCAGVATWVLKVRVARRA